MTNIDCAGWKERLEKLKGPRKTITLVGCAPAPWLEGGPKERLYRGFTVQGKAPLGTSYEDLYVAAIVGAKGAPKRLTTIITNFTKKDDYLEYLILYVDYTQEIKK